MSRPRTTVRTVGGAVGGTVGGALVISVGAEVIADRVLSGGIIVGGLVILALGSYWLLPWRRIGLAVIGWLPVPDRPQDKLAVAAEQSGLWLEAMGTDGAATIAVTWFRRQEATLRTLLDTTDPTTDRVDDLAQIADALEAWYVRQRDGASLQEVSERLAAIGEQTRRPDLQQLATLRAATAHRLLGDLQAAEQRLGPEPTLPVRSKVTAALRTRWQLEHGLIHLAKADRNAPGTNRNDAIQAARMCFDDAGLLVPRADLAGEAAIHLNLAVTYLYDKAPETALDHLRQAAARAAATRDVGIEAQVLELSGVAAWLQNHRREAIGWWRQAEQRYAEIDEHIGQARCLQHLGAAELTSNHPKRALALLEASAHLRAHTSGHDILEYYLGAARAALGAHPAPNHRATASGLEDTPRPLRMRTGLLHLWTRLAGARATDDKTNGPPAGS